MKILIMGLPGTGKTTLSSALNKLLPNSIWYNADKVRKEADDWDFSDEGRVRQAYRMKELADSSLNKYVICDFVAPTEKLRNIFNADYTIWIDTIKVSRFEDTNKVFISPSKYNIRVITFDVDYWVNKILMDIK